MIFHLEKRTIILLFFNGIMLLQWFLGIFTIVLIALHSIFKKGAIVISSLLNVYPGNTMILLMFF